MRTETLQLESEQEREGSVCGLVGWEDDCNTDHYGSDQCVAFKGWPILFALNLPTYIFAGTKHVLVIIYCVSIIFRSKSD